MVSDPCGSCCNQTDRCFYISEVSSLHIKMQKQPHFYNMRYPNCQLTNSMPSAWYGLHIGIQNNKSKLDQLSMPFSLKKTISSTHRHPVNKTLHCLGAPIYITGIALIIDNLLFEIRHPDLEYGIIMYCTAITLFLIGHTTE